MLKRVLPLVLVVSAASAATLVFAERQNGSDAQITVVEPTP